MSLLKPRLSPVLTQDVIDTLRKQGVRTVLDFLEHNAEEMVKKAGMSYKDVLAIRHVLLAQYSAVPVNGADMYEDALNSMAILPTGVKSLDTMLDGGLYTSEVTELVGPAGVGKSQLCMYTSLNISRNLKQNIMYIDSTGDFCIQRLQDILYSDQVEDEEIIDVLSRIKCSRAFDIFEVLAQLCEVTNHLTAQTNAFYQHLKLVIVDSLPAVVLPVLGGAQTDGHGYLMHLARMMKTLAVDFNLALMTTNNVVQGEAGETKPALGRAWSHIPNTRVEIKKQDITPDGENRRTAVLTKCSRQPTGLTAEFTITPSGIETYHS
ncbi:DNA repair protein RAD51 homolog 4 isoform X1 [Lingula anatina]|uniref:DNA repair protein RAD51 homolog 4 isoform X1 n=1 Tax=Lingula anatina TaxID=7574 RepID=A0A1S3JLM4_LINAN|nr:DNA repair protein RAD51 homolog 4 isoform X1 [Lingula anatina]|eukprot:XP_013411283.1 DNA repair protein RAD51 homolog 4 isoform X1 [Lingula anatina]